MWGLWVKILWLKRYYNKKNLKHQEKLNEQFSTKGLQWSTKIILFLWSFNSDDSDDYDDYCHENDQEENQIILFNVQIIVDPSLSHSIHSPNSIQLTYDFFKGFRLLLFKIKMYFFALRKLIGFFLIVILEDFFEVSYIRIERI